MGRMTGKVALITGVARGQGRSHALALAREGADIVGIDCPPQPESIRYAMASADDLRETVEHVRRLGRRMVAIEGDVRSQADLDAVVRDGIDEFGHIDVCVANAGLTAMAPFWTLTEDEWRTVIDTNLSGVWRTAKAVTPHMIERESGSIVLISSVVGLEGGAELAAYSSAKHGILGLMKCICIDLGPKYGIRCNSILPGAVDTDMVRWPGMRDYVAGGEGLGEDIDLNEATKAWHGLKGVGLIRPEEVSHAVVYLASDEAANVTGLELLVDAGHRVLPGLNTTAMAAASRS